MKERIYHALNGGLDRAGFAELREQLGGDALEIGAGTGLNIPHFRRGHGTSPRSSPTSRLTPLQRLVADGCHLNRDTAREIEAAGLRVERLESLRAAGRAPARQARIRGPR